MTNWLPVVGKAEVTAKGEVRYVPVPIEDGPQVGQNAVALLRSSVEFESGEISLEIRFSDPRSSCQVGLNQGLQPEVFVGLYGIGSPYGVSLFRNSRWENLVGAGYGNSHPVDRWISMRVVVLGSKIDLFVDDVKVCSALQTVSKSQVALFLQGPAGIAVRNIKITARRPKAFVVMQFSPEFDALYEDVIRPTCSKFGFDVIRADDIYKSGLIIEDITRSIEEASIVIADITKDNPNVFYEVGYAHAIRKPTILLSERQRSALPFDVSGFRTLFYDNTIGGKTDVEQRLTKHLEHMAV